jgi:hypothetical protein
LIPLLILCSIFVGVGKTEITPPVGTPSAGFSKRMGAPMQSVHDPLFATALCISTDKKRVILCSVDHLGFPYSLCQKIKAELDKEIEDIEIYIGGTHTHSGGGAYLDIPVVGDLIAGRYDKKITDFYIKQTAKAILQSTQNLQKAKVGIGYGFSEPITFCRKKSQTPLYDIALIKITTPDDYPIAAIFNFAAHPSILKPDNLAFSADFVGYTRSYLQEVLQVEALYFNGAQAEVKASLFSKDRFESCALFGHSLAKSIETIWHQTKTEDLLEIETKKYTYTFYPTPYLFGRLSCPLFDLYQSELNLILFNKQDAFLTIPGELSSTYDKYLKEFALSQGLRNLSILGLTNDAHGYIITPEAWDEHTFEASTSFGGKFYGKKLISRITDLISN